PSNQLTKAGGGKRCPPLGGENKRGLRLLFALKPAQCTQLLARQRMHRLRSMLSPADVDAAVLQVDRVPPQRYKLDRPQTMSVGEQDHGPVAVGVAVAPRGGG